MVIYLPQHHCLTLTCKLSTTHLCGNFIPSLVMILVLPSGSVSLLLLATVLDLDIEWNILTMSMSSMSYQSMLWVLCVTDSPLDRDHDLDLEHLPLLGRWHLSGLLPQVCVLSLWHPLSWLTFDLQHELKWFLLPHLWHFLPNAGHSLYACVKLHLLHILLVLCLSVLPLCELLAPFELPFLLPFLPCLKLSIALIVIRLGVPPLDLWQLKSFTVILCSLAYWSSVVYVTSSHLFFDQTHFFTSKCLVAWNNNSVLCTSFSASMYWHFLTRFFIHWSSLSINSSSPCLMSLYISSIWFQ